MIVRRNPRRPLFAEDIEISEAARVLWEAPFAVLAHDAAEPEPAFTYGNAAALALFECSWAELVGSPSSRSAEPEAAVQSERAALLARALEGGYVDDYEGWRVSFKGTRFRRAQGRSPRCAARVHRSGRSGGRVHLGPLVRQSLD